MTRTITDKIDNVTGIHKEYMVAKPPAPISVKIELTGKCNFRCAFCATSEGKRPVREMDWDLYIATLDELAEEGVQEVGMFYLGESMLVKWLPDAIREAKKRFGYVYLTTNGSLASADKVEACMKAGLDSLKFSLNYADAEQFTEIARVKSSIFDKMLRNIKDAYEVREAGNYGCGLFASYINYTGEQGEKMAKLLEDLDPYLDQHYALPLYSQANETGEENEDRGWYVRGGNPGRAEAMREPVPCWSLFTETRVTWDGRIAACCFDHESKFDMGPVIPFMENWHSDKFQKLRQAHLDMDVSETACKECVSYA